MLFNSLIFGVFLPTVFVLYWLVGRQRLRTQNLFVAVISYVFYGFWDWRFLVLIFVSSVVDYGVGRGLAAADSQGRRRALLALSLTVNLGLLGFFKYFHFFIDSAYAVLGWLGWHPSPITLQVLLPMGISFYTFQTLSYTVDVYRREIEPTRDFVAFLAFVSFFPQIVAGPIERARRLLPQFGVPRRFDPDKAADGMRQLLWGYVKKVLVADNLAPVVEQCFDNHGALDSLTLLCGIVLFTIQLYCDFSGYSDMAIGMARFFGFDLMRNFAYPFFARTVSEFWRRWHISLSTWFRDYIFVPLGGSRVPLGRQIFNVMVVFGVSGLWHGATWTFFFWGLLNGAYFIPSMLRGMKAERTTVAWSRVMPTLGELGAMLRTTGLFAFGLIFFRAEDWRDAFGYIGGIGGLTWTPTLDHQQFVGPMLLAVGLVCFEWFQRFEQHGLAVERFTRPVRWCLYLGLGLALLVFGSTASREFVYFQF